MNFNISKSRIAGLLFVCFASACAPKKKAVAPPVVEPPKVVAPKVEVPTGNLVPFTREMFLKISNAGLDVRKLKVFLDKTIVLNKIASNDNMEIDPVTGTLVKKTGLGENTITITPNVAGSIEAVEADGVRVNFGRAGSTLKFYSNSLSPNSFTFFPDKTTKGTAGNEVTYNNSLYRASGEGLGSTVPDAKLMIRQLDVEVGNGKGTVEPGVGGKIGF